MAKNNKNKKDKLVLGTVLIEGTNEIKMYPPVGELSPEIIQELEKAKYIDFEKALEKILPLSKETVVSQKNKYELTRLVEVGEAWCMFYVAKVEDGSYLTGYYEYTGKHDDIKSEDLIGACQLFHTLANEYNPQ